MSDKIRFWKTVLSTQEIYHACLKLACELKRINYGTYTMSLTCDSKGGKASFKVWEGDTPPTEEEMLRGLKVWAEGSGSE